MSLRDRMFGLLCLVISFLGSGPPPGAQQSHRPLKRKPGRSSQHRLSHSKFKAPYPLLALADKSDMPREYWTRSIKVL